MTKTIQSFVLAAAACTLFAGPVFAKKAGSGAVTKQQSKMGECNASAGDKKGDERKAFMKECLSAKPAKKELTPQQSKMKECAAQGKGKKGAEHKAFMKECLSK